MFSKKKNTHTEFFMQVKKEKHCLNFPTVYRTHTMLNTYTQSPNELRFFFQKGACTLTLKYSNREGRRVWHIGKKKISISWSIRPNAIFAHIEMYFFFRTDDNYIWRWTNGLVYPVATTAELFFSFFLISKRERNIQFRIFHFCFFKIMHASFSLVFFTHMAR